MGYALKSVNSIESMLRYCNDSLKWNIDEEYFDDIDELTYDFSASDLGIKDEEFAKINVLKQMRPLTDNQDWAVFFVEFEGKHIDVTDLRKVLNAIVPKRKNRDRMTWACDHIFFMCIWGEYAVRSVGFSAFEENGKTLPVMKIIYCTPTIESNEGIHNFENKIALLECNSNENFIDRLKFWSHSLKRRNQNIHSAQQLTEILANKAVEFTSILSNQYMIENDNGKIHQLFHRFNTALNIEFNETEFMQMYAQTIVYGLFSARCMCPNNASFSIDKVVECIPSTNPLLKMLMKELLDNSAVKFDELNVSELIDVLKDTDMTSILEDFNRQTGYGREDPLILFYEKFLDLFEQERKKRCGVYYTPAAVVEFIIKSVSELLQYKFHYKDGFADSRVSILDPAVGTGTFLCKVINIVYDNYKRLQIENVNFNEEWTRYLKEDLLPRIYGYEFMMAPYAMAHMKIAMKLKETGYLFPADSRLRVFLANSLIEGKQNVKNENDALEVESFLADDIRKSGKINVVIGSPPFHADSKNQNSWIMDLMNDYKKEPGTTKKLNEKNSKLINDDYVKFIRLAEEIVKSQDNAIIAYIIPSSYATNLTFRGMRWNLLRKFSEIYILDLHGNVMGRDAADSEERDENILDIQLGVCISFFIKKSSENTEYAKVYYSDFSGSREKKYQYLLNIKWDDISSTIVNPIAPYYFFKPVDLSQSVNYDTGISLSDLFPTFLGGVKTHDDSNLVSFTPFDTIYDYLYDYRPFDVRHINYDRKKISRDRYDIMHHMIGHENYGLVMDRQVVTDNWSHIQIVRHMIDNRIHYSNRGIPVLCPMFLYEDEIAKPNVNEQIVSMISEKIGLSFSETLTDAKDKFDMMDLFDYIYGILNSPLYVKKYIELLKIGFPRIPIPNSSEAFLIISDYGKKMRRLHLLEEDIGNPLNIKFEGEGDNVILSRKLKPEGLFINQTQFFSNVTEEIWNFCYGGYHGLQKWFKDRTGMELLDNDIQHVIKVLNVFDQTIRIREDLDVYMEEFNLV